MREIAATASEYDVNILEVVGSNATVEEISSGETSTAPPAASFVCPV